MLGSEAIAVTPIRRVPGEEERRQSSSTLQSDQLQGTEEALKGRGRAALDQTRNQAGGAGQAGAGFAIGGGSEQGAVSPGPVPQTALPNVGFLTQSIHQEAMGAGLHIEPWSNAIGAYRRADAGPDSGPLVSNLSV